MLCDKDNYLFQLIRNTHNNPVKASLEDGIEYKWSSHMYYTGKKSDIVDTSYALSIFSEDINKAIKLYIRFMSQGEKEIIYTDINEFQSTNSAVKKEKKELVKNITIEEIIEEVCVNENVKVSDITKKQKFKRYQIYVKLLFF